MNRDMRVVIAGLLCVTLGAVGMARCAGPDLTSFHTPGAPMYPPSDPAKVEIFRQIVPQRPYDSLGRIRLEPPSAIPKEEVDRLLRAEAAKMGADAVLVETEGTRLVAVTYPMLGASRIPRLRKTFGPPSSSVSPSGTEEG